MLLYEDDIYNSTLVVEMLPNLNKVKLYTLNQDSQLKLFVTHPPQQDGTILCQSFQFILCIKSGQMDGREEFY